MKKKVLMVCCDGFENGDIQGVIMSIVRNLSDERTFTERYCFRKIYRFKVTAACKSHESNFSDFRERNGSQTSAGKCGWIRAKAS